MNNSVKIVFTLLVVILIILVAVSLKKDKIGEDYDFEIHFFNAGKADAILIRKDDQYMMIDTGESALSDDILSYFEANNITRLEYLVITHFDKDHVGSASSIIQNIEIGEILQSNVPKESEYYTAYLEALEEKEIEPVTVSGNITRKLKDVSMTINGPTSIYEKDESNNSSLIVSMVNDNNKFLFTGDSQNQRLSDFIEENQEEYDFLKVPYHGHYLKQLKNLLENRNIKYAVITSSNEEMEDEKTIEVLNSYNIKTYLTRKGVIKVYSNGTSILIKQ